MQRREILLRTFKVSMIPHPRVIIPGPGTVFPILHHPEVGPASYVNSLKEARAVSSGYFTQLVPLRSKVWVDVRGLSATCPSFQGAQVEPSLLETAVRASYCAGFEVSKVLVGDGSRGCWVLDALEVGGLEVGLSEGPASMEGAWVEYLPVDPATGRPVGSTRSFRVDSEAASGLPAEVLVSQDILLSSPFPAQETGLSTGFVFSGCPSYRLLKVLDWTLALAGMLLSPVVETRQRHATPVGLLGSWRIKGCGATRPGFEYLAVPALGADPGAIEGLVRLLRVIFREYRKLYSFPGPWRAEPLHNLAMLRAYYAARSPECAQTFLNVMGFLLSLGLSRDEEACVEYLSDRVKRVATIGDGRYRPVKPYEAADFRTAWGIEVPPSADPTVLLSPGTLEGESAVTAISGGRSQAASVGRLAELGKDMAPQFPQRRQYARVNPGLAKELMIPWASVWGADVEPESRAVRLGPVLGIMARPREKGPIFGVETDRFELLCRMGERMGIYVYVFFPDGENGQFDYINAWVHKENAGWCRVVAPLPDVVYDRYIPRDSDPPGSSDTATLFADRYPDVAFLNSLPFTHLCRDKHRVYTVLQSSEPVRCHLPETIEVDIDHPEAIADFVSRHKKTYLKRRWGSGSEGLVLIEGTTITCIAREGGTRSYSFANLIEVMEHLSNRDLGSSIIQQGIEIAVPPSGEFGTFEIRVIYQKGGTSFWKRTGMVARVHPGSEAFIVPKKELHHKVDDVLMAVFGSSFQRVRQRLRFFADRIPPLIEKASSYGNEMSVDIGIDAAGKPWLIEVNSKPATLFRDTGAFQIRRVALQRVLNSAVSLFSQPPHR